MGVSLQTVGMSENAHRVLLISLGSRGDVQPYLPLANHLIAHGHTVGLGTNETFRPFVSEHAPDLEFLPFRGDPSSVLLSKEFEDAYFSQNTDKQIRITSDATAQYLSDNIKRLHKYVVEWMPSCLVSSTSNLAEVLALGQKYHIPVLCASCIPAYPSEELPPIGFLTKPISVKWMNKSLGWAMWRLQWDMIGEEVNALRKKDLKLPAVSGVGLENVPILNMFSQRVVPRPADYPPQVIETGYWALPVSEDYIPDQTLLDFVEEDAPVYIGFGYMPVKDKAALLEIFSSALRKMKLRGVFCAQWENELMTVPDNLLLVHDVPHSWLLPRCLMAFHHGGAGTTGASMQAGIPTVILPVFTDQPFWAARVVELGVGQNKVCPLSQVTEPFILEQLERAQQPDVVLAAQRLGEQLRAENGVHEAASYIVSYASKWRNPGLPPVDYKSDESAPKCMVCQAEFTFFFRRHHCMTCGAVCCSNCVKYFDLANYSTFRYCCKPCAGKRGWNFDAQP